MTDSRRIEKALGRIRWLARLLLVTQRSLLLVACLLAALVSFGALDFVLRFPAAIRFVVWGGGLVAIAWYLVRELGPASIFHPSTLSMALRLERLDPGVRDLLASGYELASTDRRMDPVERAMADDVVRRAMDAFGHTHPGRLLNPQGLVRTGAVFGLLAVLVASIAIAAPAHASIGARRVLAPWSGAEWQKRTIVTDATGVEVHPLGMALPVAALLERTPHDLGDSRVLVRFRRVGDDRITRQILTSQGAVPGGERYERLLEVDHSPNDTQVEVEYWFETDDDRTEPTRVLLVRPPTIVGATARIIAPEYAARDVETLSLGAGDDDRAVAGPILQGSRVEVDLEVNKPLPEPTSLRAALGVEPPEFAIDGPHWRFAFDADETFSVDATLVDEHGLSNVYESTYRFEVVEDRAPSATLTEPALDAHLLPGAIVEIAAEGRDDVGLEWIAIETMRARPPTGSIGASAEPIETWRPLGDRVDASARSTAEHRTTIDLATMGVRPGDELHVSGVVKDTYAFEGRSHEPVRSRVRRLRIVSEREFIDDIRARLGGVRRNAIALDAEQQAVRASGDARAQQGLTERLAQQTESVRALEERLERNNLEDRPLQELLSEVEDALNRAAGASAEASRAMEQGESPDEAQQEVRESLSDLIAMLDRGEDGWLVRRNVEDLLEQQRQLLEETREAASSTTGRSENELTPEQRSELERIAERQRDVGSQASDTLDELNERSDRLEELDPATAAAMQEAAERGRRSELERQAREAAEQIEQNQANAAMEQQEEMIEALEEMLEDLDNAERNRDEALRRILASLVESIEALVVRQERELASIRGAESIATLAPGMESLYQNTASVLDEVITGYRELQSVASLLEGANASQSRAIVALRSEELERAIEEENASLSQLRQARDEAREQQQQAEQQEQQRQRDELRQAYREALEEQVTLRAEVDTYRGKELGRRERAQVRGLGERQETLRTKLEALVNQTEALADAGVFLLAHRRINSAGNEIVLALRTGRVDDRIIRRQDSIVRLLQSLLDALDEADRQQEQQDEFRDEQGGTGSGSGQSGSGEGEENALIAPVAQLKLLRAMQQEASALTRWLHDRGEPAPEDLHDVSELQRELADHAMEILMSIQQPQIPGQGGGDTPPDGPGGQP